jgi:hypothetical protein
MSGRGSHTLLDLQTAQPVRDLVIVFGAGAYDEDSMTTRLDVSALTSGDGKVQIDGVMWSYEGLSSREDTSVRIWDSASASR